MTPATATINELARVRAMRKIPAWLQKVPAGWRQITTWFCVRVNGTTHYVDHHGKPLKSERNACGTFDEVVAALLDGQCSGVAVFWNQKVEAFMNPTKHVAPATPIAPKVPLSSPTSVAPKVEPLTPAAESGPTSDDFDVLPEQMVQAKRWLVWKSIPNADPTKKPRKIPYYANGSERGKGTSLDSPEDVAQLASFKDAVHALQSGAYAGLGFALGPDGTGHYFQGIDLDDVPNRPELKHIVDNLPGYTERSPSGKGMHAIGYGRPFATLGSNGTGIEAYSSSRYFTVTADGAGLHPPCDLAQFVESQLSPVHGRVKSQATAADTDRVEVVDAKTAVELRSALLSMPSDERNLWIRMGHALKTLGDVGRGMWLEWSSTSDKFDAANAARTWRSFKPSNTGYQAVFAEAQRHGWVNPLSNAATGGASSNFSAGAAPTPYPIQENGPGAQIALPVDLETCVVDLSEQVSPDSSHPHVIEKLVPQGEVTLLAGHGGTGKSYIILLVLIHVALGKPFGNLATTRTRVVFFSAEDGKEELLRRVARICRLLGVNQSELKNWLFLMDVSDVDATLYRVGRHSQAVGTPQLESLSTYVRDYDIGLTVIDNASDVFDGNEIVRTEVRGFVRTLRRKLARPHRAVILLAHVSKAAAHNKRVPGAATNEDYSGSTDWNNVVRSRLSLDTDDLGVSTLRHIKANTGPKNTPISLEWHDGAPTMAGTYDVPGAELAATLRKSSEQNQDDSYKIAILDMVLDFDRRNERVTTSMQGGYTVFKTLSSSPDFPKGLTSERLNRLVRELERNGRIVRKREYTKNRKWVDSFTRSKDGVESAPNPADRHPIGSRKAAEVPA